MKLNKSVVRILAVLLVAVMAVGAAGCAKSYRTNPVVAKVGSVSLDFNQYMTLFNNTDSTYYQLLSYGYITGEQYANYILNDLVTYGVQLDQAKVQNITLDAEEETKLKEDVEKEIKSYLDENYSSKIDSSITDADAKYNAMLDLLKKDLKKEHTNFDKYKQGIEDALRNTALIEKLQELTVKDVTINNDDVKKYFEDNVKKDITMSSFNSTWQNFITQSAKLPPLYMPQPEKAVEDDPETEDKDETKAAELDAAVFSVQHLLMKFTTEADDSVSDLNTYLAQDEELTQKMKDFEDTLTTLTTEQFLEKCHDKSICDDPGMLQPSFQYFGYMMQKSLIDSYYKGFGYASMKLRFGEDWEPESESDKTTTADNKPEIPEYMVWYYDLADGGKVAKVLTNAGIHYIIVNPNDCYGIYDEDGYLMIPAYDGDELVKDNEGIVTLSGGHMTQAQLDTVNEILKNVKATIEIKDDDTETTEDPESTETPDATEEPDATPAPEDNETEDDTEEEEEVIVTAKSLYDYCNETKLEAAKAELYSDKIKEWTENTKIKTNKSLLKTLYKG